MSYVSLAKRPDYFWDWCRKRVSMLCSLSNIRFSAYVETIVLFRFVKICRFPGAGIFPLRNVKPY